MIVAAIYGRDICVRVLIAANADMAYASRNGWTALHCAAYWDHASTCRVLVDEEALLIIVRSKRHRGKTPLELARAQGNAECVAILEAAGAAMLVLAEIGFNYKDDD